MTQGARVCFSYNQPRWLPVSKEISDRTGGCLLNECRPRYVAVAWTNILWNPLRESVWPRIQPGSIPPFVSVAGLGFSRLVEGVHVRMLVAQWSPPKARRNSCSTRWMRQRSCKLKWRFLDLPCFMEVAPCRCCWWMLERTKSRSFEERWPTRGKEDECSAKSASESFSDSTVGTRVWVLSCSGTSRVLSRTSKIKFRLGDKKYQIISADMRASYVPSPAVWFRFLATLMALWLSSVSTT